MSSVHFLCHFGTCCQSCVCSFLYMHFISDCSFRTRATQFKHSRHVAPSIANRAKFDTSLWQGFTYDTSARVFILGKLVESHNHPQNLHINTLPTRWLPNWTNILMDPLKGTYTFFTSQIITKQDRDSGFPIIIGTTTQFNKKLLVFQHIVHSHPASILIRSKSNTIVLFLIRKSECIVLCV